MPQDVRRVYVSSRSFTRHCLLIGLLCQAAATQTVWDDGVVSVSPGSAVQGAGSVQVTFDLVSSTPPTPPTEVSPVSATIGAIAGSTLGRNGWQVSASFNIPPGEPIGSKTVQVTFPAPPEIGGTIILQKLDAFTVLSGGEGEGEGEDESEGEGEGEGEAGDYVVVDTGQSVCYDTSSLMGCPTAGQAFYGQDGQVQSAQPSYALSSDGLTVADNRTGLTWQRSPDTNGDGDINADDKKTWSQVQAYPGVLNSLGFGGYDDWRLPTIKELYSLIDFRGIDPSGYEGSDTSGLTPFIATNYFAFSYGDTSAGERIIDAQFASSTLYVSPVTEQMLFGVNFADGRIKGYGLSVFGAEKTFYVICTRGNTSYGQNDFVDNGDGTVSDRATGLSWAQADSGTTKNWEEALAWVAAQNDADYLGHNDWRLPNVKEIQSIIDYTRSPDTTGSAAIDPVFSVTPITNEAGHIDFACYWSSTTHVNWTATPGEAAAYVAFGRALGHMNGSWTDVHGAGSQRSDPKAGDPAAYPFGRGPQGDAIRIYNMVRLVRDDDIAGDGLVVDFTAYPTRGKPPLTVVFTGNVTGATKAILNWQWDLGDGTIVDGDLPEVSHTYDIAGRYTVALTVTTSSESRTATKQEIILVSQSLPVGRATVLLLFGVTLIAATCFALGVRRSA